MRCRARRPDASPREANLAAKRAQDRAKDGRIAELEAELTAKKKPDLRIV